jgi:hypothetical protein
MSEGKGISDLSLRTNRKNRAQTIRQISGPIQKTANGQPSTGGKQSQGSQPRPQAGGKVQFDSVFEISTRHYD